MKPSPFAGMAACGNCVGYSDNWCSLHCRGTDCLDYCSEWAPDVSKLKMIKTLCDLEPDGPFEELNLSPCSLTNL